jgi:hypothetical protein
MRISELATGNDSGDGSGRDLGKTPGIGERDLRGSIQSLLVSTRWAEVAEVG